MNDEPKSGSRGYEQRPAVLRETAAAGAVLRDPDRRPEDPNTPVERALAALDAAEARAAESERRLQELSAELLAARAAAAASSLVLAKASHELRTPLNGIIGLAEILRHKTAQGTMPPAETRRLADDIHESGVHLLNVLEALLDWSRPGVAQWAPPRTVAVRGEIELALAAIGTMADRNRIAVENACDPSIKWTVDRRAFRQVAINLASNAVKFSPPGSRVLIAATPGPDALALHVGDQGPGVAESDRERILLPFSRGSDAERNGIEGIGLGLTVVAELLKRQGGRLIIESAPGGGSVFTAVFPALGRPEGKAPE